MTKKRSLADWLADAGLRNLPLEELVDGFARRLNETGIPVARMFAGRNTLHSQMLFRSLTWDRATGPATHFEFQHADADRPIVQESPFADMLRQNLAEWRVDPRLRGVREETELFTLADPHGPQA